VGEAGGGVLFGLGAPYVRAWGLRRGW